MRMRRTAFIVALMTVFTVSLFAQSRGRNYIKQNISEWGGCRNVAITDTGGDLAPNFTKEQKQRFLKATMKFVSASKNIKNDQ